MVDAVGIEEGRAAFDAVDDVALVQQELCELGAVLASNAGDELAALGEDMGAGPKSC